MIRYADGDDDCHSVIDMFTDTTNSTNTTKRICYFDDWSQFRKGHGIRHSYTNIDPSLCSHIVFAFVGMNGNDLIATEYHDEDTAIHKGV